MARKDADYLPGTLIAGELEAEDAPPVAHFHEGENIDTNANVLVVLVTVIAHDVGDVPEHLDLAIGQLV
jgi:hypothetical protein